MSTESPAAPEVHRALGLTNDELDRIHAVLDRDPTYTELAMFSVMWSEHCSYKSSRPYLRTLPISGPHVVVGPGEGAGIVEVAPGARVAWKIESHNHPSFVEPFNGAATGVGGIVRDIVSMGARPIALMDSLRFGPLDDVRTRYLVEGVVHGISSYGNSIGVPTVGGETVFDTCYAENPLVNVACLGFVEERLMTGRADGPGNAVVLFGSATGRDGIGGASVLASASFDETSSEKRPSVQVGDPFTEKLVIEASLELVQRELIVGFQDLGAGGVTCPTSEMSAKAGTGMRVDASRIHRREPGMEPFEVMISESQERMLAVVEPDKLVAVLDVCARWGLRAEVIGEVSDTPRLHVRVDGEAVADVPAGALADGPVYDRPAERPVWLDELQAASPGGGAPPDLAEAFLELLASPGIASKRWVWEQYDHMIFLGTVQGPGGDAAVIRLPNRHDAVAIAVDGPGRLCQLDPYRGARRAVAEAARNVAVVGARPLAITNCLNFGSPENPAVMWQFAEVTRGISDACTALETPVTGGNVSFYNETTGRPIYPTPVIGMLGSAGDPASCTPDVFAREGDAIVLFGSDDPVDFAGSEYSKVIERVVGGRPCDVDLDAERRLHGVLIESRERRLLHSAHDVSSGGLAVALAESGMRGGVGFRVTLAGDEPHRAAFSETPSRAIVSCDPSVVAEVVALASSHGVSASVLGSVGGHGLDFGAFSVSFSRASAAFSSGLEAALSATIVE